MSQPIEETMEHRQLEQSNFQGLGMLIFSSRWLQAPIYLGLIVAQLVYVVVFVVDLISLINDDVVAVIQAGSHPDESVIMLGVLALIDVAMIANLLIMVIIGGYETFVSKIDLSGHRDQPDWLSHVNENVLKVKLAMAIIGISSIHLLKTFIEVTTMQDGIAVHNNGAMGTITAEGAFWQVCVHMTLLMSAVVLQWIDRVQVNAATKARLVQAQGAKLHAEADAIRAGLAQVQVTATVAEPIGGK